MGSLRCTTCGDVIDTREAMSCSNCGCVCCSSCGTLNGGTCSNCYSGLNYSN